VGGPHCQLLAGRVDHDGAWLHECGDQALLAEPSLDHDAVRVGLSSGDGGIGAAPAAGLARVEDPQRIAVGAQLGVYQGGAVGQRALHVEDRVQLVVVDFDSISGIPGRWSIAGHHDRHSLTGEVHGVEGERRGLRRLHVRSDRPRTGQADCLGAEIGGGEHAVYPGPLGFISVDSGDLRVGQRAAYHGDVQHPGQRDVVRPAGPSGDQPGILLALARTTELGGCRLRGSGHQFPPPATVLGCCADTSMGARTAGFICCAASSTARTMFW
jgi:hypothetical protein